MIREDNNVQHPIYYISKRLAEVEIQYPLIEKWTYCLILSTRNLRPYLQALPIWVYTNQPLRQVLLKLDASGWLLKWKLSWGIAVKRQALTDFVVECTSKEASSLKDNLEREREQEKAPPQKETVKIS
ncbi:uncharacterized protein LOC133031248 [Cannabis sativa]|uniref:uncharacterized protein LOC133031248 n=1 Tax=Cannabis sativa TaxID=3483 RepID=UPI0029CA44B9|nr:uncharacterized protein LOC133031248 [Cannabis sativa]